jgi:hypothetical protein
VGRVEGYTFEGGGGRLRGRRRAGPRAGVEVSSGQGGIDMAKERSGEAGPSRSERRGVVGPIVGVAAVLLGLTAAAIVLLFATAPSPEEADAWSLGPPLPSARGELATAVVHAAECPAPPCPELERLYVVGGLAGPGRPQDGVARFDPTAGAWRDAPPLPSPRHHPGAAGLGGALYVSGGTADVRQPWSPESDFWRLEDGGASWERLPAMPEGRFGHRLVAWDGRLYVVGGMGPTSRVLVYDPGDPAAGWRTGAAMPGPRDHLSVVVVDGLIWAIGGRHPESLRRVDIYDPAADAWRPGPPLPAPTSGAAEGVVDGVVLVYGGEEPGLVGGRVFDRHWMLDTRVPEPAWRPAPPPPLAVHGADGAVFQGRLVIVGGASRHGMLSVTAWTDVFQRLDGLAAWEDG